MVFLGMSKNYFTIYQHCANRIVCTKIRNEFEDPLSLKFDKNKRTGRQIILVDMLNLLVCKINSTPKTDLSMYPALLKEYNNLCSLSCIHDVTK